MKTSRLSMRLRQAGIVALCATLVLGSASPIHAQTDDATKPASAVPAAPRPSANRLPTLGEGTELAASAERKLGDRIAREMYRDPDYIDDPVLMEYVQGIWQPLLAAARERGEISPELEQRFAWEVLLGRDRQVNAFALPGGYLGLYLGLIAVVSSRDELASVLGHELSHVTQRHISRLISKQGAQLPWLIGAMILGALAAAKNPDAANAAIMGGQAIAAQNQLNFSRDMEREADRVGFGVMTQAGFEARGFVSMFDKLQQASRLSDNGDFPYLRSHPLTSERIGDMQARQPQGAPTAPIPLTMEQALISARAQVLSNTDVESLRRTLADAGSPALSVAPVVRQAAAQYAATLAAARQRDYAAAKGFLARLLLLVQGNDAGQRLAALLAVELALQSGEAAPPLVSKGRPELLFSTQVLVREGRAKEALPALQTWVALHPRDASAWQALAAACNAQGLALRALRADAEARAAQLDYAAALDRLKAAQALVHSAQGNSGLDHIEASIVDTRARQIQSLLREQALER